MPNPKETKQAIQARDMGNPKVARKAEKPLRRVKCSSTNSRDPPTGKATKVGRKEPDSMPAKDHQIKGMRIDVRPTMEAAGAASLAASYPALLILRNFRDLALIVKDHCHGKEGPPKRERPSYHALYQDPSSCGSL